MNKLIKTAAIKWVYMAVLAVVAVFCGHNAAFAASNLPGRDLKPEAGKVIVKFIGTGAADWTAPRKDGEFRRLTSILVNDKFLIDYTASDKDMLPEGFCPEAIFYTHSHSDHFNAEAALNLGVTKVYVGETWLGRAQKAFAKASQKTGIAAPEIIPVVVGGRYLQDGLVLTALPGNHATGDPNEQALIYLIESTTSRVLYATDTAGITAQAAKISGLDAHKAGTPINGLIMEATVGMGHETDFRYFNHSSVDRVATIVKVLRDSRRYAPKPGQSVYITHLSYELHGTQADLDKNLPKPLKAAYDGLTVEF